MHDKRLIAVLFEEVRGRIPAQTTFLKTRYDSREQIFIISCPGPARFTEHHTFNRTGAEVLTLCDGRRTIGQIVGEMSGRYSDTNEELLTEDVISVIRTMERKGILRFLAKAPPAETSRHGLE